MTHSQKDGRTYFSLAKGTQLSFGSISIILEESITVSTDGAISFDGITETICGTGLANQTANEPFELTKKK